MIFLRLLALVAGTLVLILPPMVVAQSANASMPAWIAIGGLAGLALVALSYLYVAVFADRMRRSGHYRMLGGLLLLIPIAVGVTTLATRTDADLLIGSAILLAFTVLLFITFVYPAASGRRQRPMRRRERSEPVLAVVQQLQSARRRGTRS